MAEAGLTELDPPGFPIEIERSGHYILTGAVVVPARVVLENVDSDGNYETTSVGIGGGTCVARSSRFAGNAETLCDALHECEISEAPYVTAAVVTASRLAQIGSPVIDGVPGSEVRGNLFRETESISCGSCNLLGNSIHAISTGTPINIGGGTYRDNVVRWPLRPGSTPCFLGGTDLGGNACLAQ